MSFIEPFSSILCPYSVLHQASRTRVLLSRINTALFVLLTRPAWAGRIPRNTYCRSATSAPISSNLSIGLIPHHSLCLSIPAFLATLIAADRRHVYVDVWIVDQVQVAGGRHEDCFGWRVFAHSACQIGGCHTFIVVQTDEWKNAVGESVQVAIVLSNIRPYEIFGYVVVVGEPAFITVEYDGYATCCHGHLRMMHLGNYLGNGMNECLIVDRATVGLQTKRNFANKLNQPDLGEVINTMDDLKGDESS
jgi:hypothetical protein